ncbi:ATP-binding protein [Bullifex porci]|uniref:ATP-binding protein n=1 Tax=Bullifex porci TaxID=2606638 RepID=UPI0023F2EC31|nr:AAA family ATPase [Bullifex porci]MDD7255504.1 AAA family ATPase [Bullifex porci]MDY2740873.1 AAA family ATPase [Bullifex porci]
MLKRKISDYLESYFTPNRREALLITGARQVGKSYAIREFGKSHYSSFIEINLLEDSIARTSISKASNSKDLLLRITAIASQPLIKGKTLIFFDEVQVVPEIVTAIKFLVEEGSYQYVLSGSLLGIGLKRISSMPVGYLTVKEMYPLNLEEFYRACGISDNIFSVLEGAFKAEREIDSIIHRKLMELFRLYLIVGGMPAVVQTYLDTNDIKKVVNKQREILSMYVEDISQYDINNKLYIKDIFNLIPAELNNPNKRFILKNLNENTKFSRLEDSFIWIREAGVAIGVYNIEEPKLPLELAKLRNLFKLFSNDVGLLACQYADSIQLRILNNDIDINYGSIYENAVAEELYSHGLKLYYFNSKKQGELDFVIKLDDKLLPIEVKSGKNYLRHNALKNVIENKDYEIEKAYVLYNENIKRVGNIVYLPIYLMMFIKNREIENLIWKIDLSSLPQ